MAQFNELVGVGLPRATASISSAGYQRHLGSAIMRCADLEVGGEGGCIAETNWAWAVWQHDTATTVLYLYSSMCGSRLLVAERGTVWLVDMSRHGGLCG